MHFHYPGGGFPLEAAVYRIEPIDRPREPTAPEVREHLVERHAMNGKKPPSDGEIAAALERAAAELPAAMHGWQLAPYRITVQVAGHPQRHVLVYQHAARFLRALGVLRHCQVCEKWTIAHDPPPDPTIIICDRCGYVAEDWL
jgi:hypothetical protein